MRKQEILNYCRENIEKFIDMSDTDIYCYLHSVFPSDKYETLRECSILIFYECILLYM